MLHQTFEPHDLVIVFVLVVLEGMLSMDNALVLGLLAKRLPEEFRGRALSYGLVGSLVFRVVAIGVASVLLEWRLGELLGGIYLAFVAVRHFWKSPPKASEDRGAVDREGNPVLINEETGRPFTEEELGAEMAEQTHGQIRNRDQDYSNVQSTHEVTFWMAVLSIEFTDIVFAVDSILAAVALVGPPPKGTPFGQLHPKLWVVVAGGMGGVVMMRFAAMIFIKLLERFPRFEISAYLLVMLIGAKMIVEYFLNGNPRWPGVDFNDPSDPGAWIFWGLIACALGVGFVPHKRQRIAKSQ